MATDVQATAPGLRMLLAPNPSPMTLDGTRTYIVGEQRPVVIDPGPDDPAHVESILRALADRPPVAILLTHAHGDHAGAAPALSERTGAPVHLHPEAVPKAGIRKPRLEIVRGGERVEIEAGGTITTIATPGHSPDHLAFLWEGGHAPERGAVFVGDLLMGEGDTTLVAPPEGDLGDYLASLARLRGLDAGVLYPTHGPPLTDAEGALDRYRRHREARIAQVAQTVEERPGASARELVPEIYGSDLHPALATAAAGSIAAILAYLSSRSPRSHSSTPDTRSSRE